MPKVVIAGAGLVGSLNACYFAERGWEVEVYEFRKDIRQMEHVPGRSINLALSQRGKSALERVGLKDYIVEQGVPMYSRLVHNKDGKTFSRQPYGQPGQHIVSINRRHLNEVMISQAEKGSNVKFFFEHKVKSVDLEKNEITVQFTGGSKIPRPGAAKSSSWVADLCFPPSDPSSNNQSPSSNVTSSATPTLKTVKADLILACDGAYSAIRRSLATQPRFDYSQEYIEHGYVELNIGPKNDEFALEPNVFHLWPRGHFTLIALANMDKTFTVTIFAPFAEFEKHMSTPEQVESFFKENFVDAYNVLGRDHILSTFARVRPQSLVSIKCNPHHFGDSVLLMGDAAHAMVPFYGQGMNCGFEDCLVLSDILNECGDDIPAALSLYTQKRVKDAHTINDLAMYNYEELKDLVNHPSYKLRKKLDLWLNRLMPNTWIPLYSMVTFNRIPYSQVVEDRKWQDKVLSNIARGISLSTLLGALGAGMFYAKKTGLFNRS